MRGPGERAGADCLRDTGRFPVEHRSGRLGRDVARREPCAACCQHNRASAGEIGDRAGDLVALVGDDPALDREPVCLEQLGERVAALVLTRAVVHPVRDRQHGRLHTASFVFSTSVTSEMTMVLSIAFAMS